MWLYTNCFYFIVRKHCGELFNYTVTLTCLLNVSPMLTLSTETDLKPETLTKQGLKKHFYLTYFSCHKAKYCFCIVFIFMCAWAIELFMVNGANIVLWVRVFDLFTWNYFLFREMWHDSLMWRKSIQWRTLLLYIQWTNYCPS